MKENSITKGMPNKQLRNLGQFRNDLADDFCNMEYGLQAKKPRRSSHSQWLQEEKALVIGLNFQTD